MNDEYVGAVVLVNGKRFRVIEYIHGTIYDFTLKLEEIIDE